MEYTFQDIENKWQKFWADKKTFKTENSSEKPKFYVLDMFPYPSGAGLHVGHPLGYIASDIYARFKRHKGFNVLHPMGYDSFGLPAEQYAIQTGQHPAITTEQNIKRYREQLDKIGFSFDWDREVRTSDPNYYKWTQWIFIQLFNSWYNPRTNKAEPIDTLTNIFETEGFKGLTHDILTGDIEEDLGAFTPQEWKSFDEKKRSAVLMNFRIAYLGEAYVNWCPTLGTVLANDEVKDGMSERGGYPVERKLMKQWSMRITAYAQRLLDGLDKLDWTDSLKEAQRNWIGRSEGCSLNFKIDGHNESIEVFTTRPDTIFGVSFLTLAPEHELVEKLTVSDYKQKVDEYITYAKNRSERERQADVKKISGQFTGSYALHPFTGKQVPVWIGDYVLAGYGTGAVMAVPAHDTRDYAFAKHFDLPIIEVIQGGDISVEAYDAKEGKLINSDFLNGLEVKAALKKVISVIEEKNLGKGKINYRLRDAVFGRQRYWGEPFPVYYKDGIPHVMDESELPLVLPEVDKFLPTESGEPPLARATNWKYKGEYEYEQTTMPGWAGSSWYFLRYMDAKNPNEFVSKQAADYWQSVDLYLGGSEHATGHLLYARFWTMFLFDRGYINFDEPARKLINQGMIQGRSNTIHRVFSTNIFLSDDIFQEFVEAHKTPKSREEHSEKTITNLLNEIETQLGTEERKRIEELKEKNNGFQFSTFNIDISKVKNDILLINEFMTWREEFNDAKFIKEKNGVFKCGVIESEKMSKSKYNVVIPDDICVEYGADTLRLYEMFLGPLEQSKPWNTNGITGVHGFLKRLWRLFHSNNNEFFVSNESAVKAELKALHKTIKKISDDIERYSFNTSVSNFMILVNELTDLKCHKREILDPLLVLISPYAPHIAEELWSQLGHSESIAFAAWPEYVAEHTIDDSFAYPISFNGKMRFNLEMPLSLNAAEIEAMVMEAQQTKRVLDGKQPKKVIVVPKKIVNIVM